MVAVTITTKTTTVTTSDTLQRHGSSCVCLADHSTNGMLVSYCFCNESIQNWWLNTDLLKFWRSEVQKRSHWAKIKMSAGLHYFWML